MSEFRRPSVLVPVLLAAALLLIGGNRPALAGVDLETAQKELAVFDDHLKSSRSSNDDLLASLGAVAAAYKDLEGPPEPKYAEVPADASDEQKAEIEKANEKLKEAWEAEKTKFEREAGKFRKEAQKAMLKALQLEKVNTKTNANIRMDVNIAAARALGDTGDKDVASDIQGVLERKIFKAKYEVPALLLDETFAALGRLNDHKVLDWMTKEFIHTKSSPREVVDQLQAAHKAMILFKDVDAKRRYTLVQDMVRIYASTESQAMQSSNDPKIQATKQFWDRIKNDTIRAVQYFAGEPTKEGQALATMQEFQEWWREHDRMGKEPWKDEKP